MVLTSVACLGEGAKGSSNTVFALLMTTAWLAWYRFGRIDRRWWAAWFTSLFLVFVACLATGAYAIGYFYVPLLFLRRPLRAWPRMRILGHFVALGALAAGIALWLWLCPNQAFAPWRAAALDGGVPAYAGYLRDVLTFPFRCAVDLFPWSFLAWPPFCVAFRPVEKTPVLCRFLRTVVGSLFLVAWLIPGASPRSLLPLVGPLAILTGLYYETLLRRHWPQLRNLVHYLTGAALAAGVACVITGLLHVAGVVVFASISPVAWGINMALLLAAVWLARWVRSSGTIRSFWLQLLLATAACRLVYLATYPPFHALCRGERRITGGWLAEAVPANETVYKTDPRLLVPECFYLQRPVRQITDSRALPASERAKPVYVLAGDHPPILEPDRRVWTACSRPVDVRSRRVPRIRWGAGDRGILRVEADFVNSEEGGSDAATVRVYRGDLRPAAGEATPGPAGPAATRPGTKGTGS
jgi:hypothetical protein